MKRVGILYHPKIAAAKAFAEELAGFLPSLNAVVWLCSAWDEEGAKAQVENTGLILSIGGDGTIFSVDAGVVLCTDGARDITEAPGSQSRYDV